METPHNAHNMFDMVQDSLRDWKIEDKIFSFTLDNAPVNTSMVGHLRIFLADRQKVEPEDKEETRGAKPEAAPAAAETQWRLVLSSWSSSMNQPEASFTESCEVLSG